MAEQLRPKPVIGDSRQMQEVRSVIRSVSRRVCTVLINGESGTGKELVAQHVHYCGPLANEPFVPVDCTTLRDNLFESQLFGHVKGAFTGADRDSIGFFRAADGGTLFLDEIAELDPHVQARLLRCIQERAVVPLGSVAATPVNVRIIAATHRDLEDMIEREEFRQDLFFRLNVVSLNIAPLRERREDILPLAHSFLRSLAEFYQESPKVLSDEAAEALEAYDWPGNVREVANVFERVYALCQSDTVTLVDLPPAIAFSAPEPEQIPDYGITPLDEAERALVERALKTTDGNQARAANLLRIDRRRMYRLVRRFKLRELTRRGGTEIKGKPQLLKTSAAAARLGCDPAFVRREVVRGNLPGYRIGPRGDIRIPADAVDQYLLDHNVQANTD